jgi:hypothetical protein
MWSVAPNAILGLLVIVTLAFTSGDVQKIMQTPTGEPFIQIFYDVTESKAAATVMASIVVILLCSCCFSEVATSSRQLWSFARDRGVPASSWLSHVCIPIPTANELVTDSYPGPSRMEYPRTSCHGFVRRRLSTRLHQHWIDNSPKINIVSRCCCHPQLLLGRDRHVDLASIVRRSTSSSQMVARQIWTRHQHRGCVLYLAALVLCILAHRYASDGRNDELGERHICGCPAYRCDLLRR